jgi:CBS domain-containing protein
MTVTILELMKDKPKPIVAHLKEPIQDALFRMVEHDFSQLPIVNNDNQPEGMVTIESILRALNNFGVGLDKLCVEHARVPVTRFDTFRSDDDLRELLERLQAYFAVLIVDGDGRLTGIVTGYDIAQYFRRRAEDMMFVEDIETTIKDYIQVAYHGEGGVPDKDKLEEAVLQIAPGRHFDNLSLYQYINLFLNEQEREKYESIFNLEREALLNLLNRVRKIRNALAHFRREITAAERDHLRFTYKWLDQYQDAYAIAYDQKAVEVMSDEMAAHEELETEITPQQDDDENILPVEDEADPRESRYAPLAVWLQNQTKKDLIELTLDQVESIIGSELPRSAYEHRAWWANDPIGTAHSQQWLDVGWRVASANLPKHVVRFGRIQGRQNAYIDFFSKLTTQLKTEPGYEYLEVMPDGTNWSWARSVMIDDRNLGMFNFSFGRGNTFRIELYIDSGRAEINKRLFDLLHERRAVIEQELGHELRWQRLNNRRASRVARMLWGTITDSEEKLAQLRATAVPAMVSFVNVFQPHLLEIGRQVLAEISQ